MASSHCTLGRNIVEIVMRRTLKTLAVIPTSGPLKMVSRSDSEQHRELKVVDVSDERMGAFDDALSRIAVGERIIYHVGEYCAGAHRTAARTAYESGFVTLSLRRRSQHRFEYIAIKIAERG